MSRVLAGLPGDMSDMGNSTERERLLHVVLTQTNYYGVVYSDKKDSVTGGHIAAYKQAEVGDLVWGRTRDCIGRLVKVEKKDCQFDTVYSVKLLGTEFVQTWSNESFYPILGIPKRLLYTGDVRKFALFAYDAILRGDEHQYRFESIDVDDASDHAFVKTRIRWSKMTHTATIHNWKYYLKYKTGTKIFTEMKKQGFMNPDFYTEVVTE